MTTRHRKNTSGLDFGLQPNVTVTRQLLPHSIAYVFRDFELGELGRLAVEGTATGETRITSEVAGFPSDPMMQRRLAAFEPLCKEINAQAGVSARGRPHCETCGKIVAFLIFANGATDDGLFEDYARHNVPAYIIGPELGDGPMEHRPANILKVWPQRGAMECLRPDEFNPRIEKLVTQHCD